MGIGRKHSRLRRCPWFPFRHKGMKNKFQGQSQDGRSSPQGTARSTTPKWPARIEDRPTALPPKVLDQTKILSRRAGEKVTQNYGGCPLERERHQTPAVIWMNNGVVTRTRGSRWQLYLLPEDKEHNHIPPGSYEEVGHLLHWGIFRSPREIEELSQPLPDFPAFPREAAES